MDVKNFYLQKVILYTKKEERIYRCDKLLRLLRQRGVKVDVLSEMKREKAGEDLATESEFPDGNILFVTDDGKQAIRWRKAGYPVLGYLHEDNRNEDFGEISYCMEKPEEITPDYLERVYRRYRDIPWDILVTERCLIRETTVEDIEELFTIYQNPAMTRYTDGLHADIEEEKAYTKAYIKSMYHYYEYGIWTVVWRENGQIIGRAGFSEREGCHIPQLGFAIAAKWQRQGIAYEICRAILEYGWNELEFERVQAMVHPENTASMNLCKKLGFVMDKYIDGENICLMKAIKNVNVRNIKKGS